MSLSKLKMDAKLLIGWREWLQLPDLKISKIKAKIDTGAKTSALHAFSIEEFIKNKTVWVRFNIHPSQRSKSNVIKAQAPLVEMRKIKDSGGKITNRHVIETPVKIAGSVFKIEVTLINRDEMGFRMLLGRDALNKRFIIDPSKSFLLSSKQKKQVKAKSNKIKASLKTKKKGKK